MAKVDSAAFWETAYQNETAYWDMGRSHPVFEHLAASGQFSPGQMIVLGAGRGYDARLFAQHGFEVTAVDFAADAARDMHALNDAEAPIEIVQADIFNLPSDLEGTFDYLLEYTCFCAIDPARRPEYADLAARLLRLGGTFIALAFPIWEREGGPPFAVTADETIALFEARGFSLLHREDQPSASVKSRRAFESLLILKKNLSAV